MDKVIGQLNFFTEVETVQNGKTTRKRTRLGSVWCAQPECIEKREEFCALNHWIKSDAIFAEFVYREFL